MIDINTAKELKNTLSRLGGNALVSFWKNGCPGCMKVSKLLPLLEDEDHPIIRFNCSHGYDEASEFGVNGTPVWTWYENGEAITSIHPAHNDDELWEFVTETMRVDILRPFFDIALEQGLQYAKQIQAAIAELMFRSTDDGDGIVNAAVLKICKACEAADAESIDNCIDTQIEYCINRLKEQMNAPDGATPARQDAIKRIGNMKIEIKETLLKVKTNQK